MVLISSTLNLVPHILRAVGKDIIYFKNLQLYPSLGEYSIIFLMKFDLKNTIEGTSNAFKIKTPAHSRTKTICNFRYLNSCGRETILKFFVGFFKVFKT